MSENESPSTDNDDSTKSHIRGSAFLFSGRILAVAIGALVQILIVRYLVKEDYGALAYALNFVEIIALFSLMGLHQAAGRFIPVYLEKEDRASFFGFIVLSVASILGLGLASVVFLAGTSNLILGRVIEGPLTLNILLVMIILAPIQAIDTWFQSIFAAFNEVRGIFLRRYVLAPLLKLLIVVLVVVLRASVYYLAIGYIVSGIVGVVLYATMFVSLLRQRDLLGKIQWKNINFNSKQIYGFSLPILGSAIVIIFRSRLAAVFLEFFVDVTAVADFRAVQPIARINSVVYESFIYLYLPMAAKLLERNDTEGLNNLYWRTTSWISIASFPGFIVTFALASEFVPLLLGEQYRSAVLVMSILALGYYFNALMGFNLHTMRAYDKVKYLAVVDVATMIIAVLSYLIFIPIYGAVGGAIAFTVGTFAANILNHIGLARYTDINLLDPYFLQVYVSLFIATVAIGALQVLFQPSIFVSVPIAAVISIIVLRLNAGKLQVDEMFPELLKVPFLKYLIQP